MKRVGVSCVIVVDLDLLDWISDELSPYELTKSIVASQFSATSEAPLATGRGLLRWCGGQPGGCANDPLARTIIGGGLAAAVLTIVVIPCLHVMFKREESEADLKTI